MTTNPATTVRLYTAGEEFELWEDSDHPFGCAPADLCGYLERESWVMLFNAITLAAGSLEPKLGS